MMSFIFNFQQKRRRSEITVLSSAIAAVGRQASIPKRTGPGARNMLPSRVPLLPAVLIAALKKI